MALQEAFGSPNWKMTLDILHLPPAEVYLGLWMPKVYPCFTHALSFKCYLQNPARFGFVQRNALRDWLQYKGIVHHVSHLSLLQLSPCTTHGVPWLAYCLRVVSELTKLRSGASLSCLAVPGAPLWNICIFLLVSQTVACKYLIYRGLLPVPDLIDESTWTVILSDGCRGPMMLRAPH